MSPPVLSYFQRLAMSYRYGGGEYRNESTSASSSTSQFPQWETLEQQQQQIAEPQQQSEAVLTPTQPLHHSFFPIADEHLPPGQLLPHLPSPTDPPHLPLISHQGSYDSTSDGRFNSLSPADVGTPSSTPTDPTPKPSRSGRGRHPLQRAHARTIANPYPPSSMHAMQPPPVPPGREHRVGDPNMFMHHSPQATSTASPITNTSNTVGSPSVAQSGGLPEVNRNSPYSPSASNTFPPPQTPPIRTSANIPVFEHEAPPQVQRPQARSQALRRLTPRADMNYDPNSHVLSVSMELPGVKKTQLRLTLATCIINRVRQLIVKGRSDPVFGGGASSSAGINMDGIRAIEGDGGTATESGPSGSGGQGDVPSDGLPRYAVRERKYGDFSRVLNVPSETRAEDIEAEMEDGVLTLKIACGPPAESQDTQVVPVR